MAPPFDDASLPITIVAPNHIIRASITIGVVICVAGLICVGLSALAAWSSAWASLALLLIAGGLLLTFGVVLSRGARRMSIVLTSSAVIVHGAFSSRTVRRAAIEAVWGNLFIVWRTAEGRRRRTFVTALNIRSPKSAAVLHDGIVALRAWAGVSDPRTGNG